MRISGREYKMSSYERFYKTLKEAFPQVDLT